MILSGYIVIGRSMKVNILSNNTIFKMLIDILSYRRIMFNDAILNAKKENFSSEEKYNANIKELKIRISELEHIINMLKGYINE